jgi:hypothetical protein
VPSGPAEADGAAAIGTIGAMAVTKALTIVDLRLMF